MVLMDSLDICIGVSSFFEGNDGYGNVAGNFDGAILSAGALCFTYSSGNLGRILVDGLKGTRTALSDIEGYFVSCVVNRDSSSLLEFQKKDGWKSTVKSVMMRPLVIEAQKKFVQATFLPRAKKSRDLIISLYPEVKFIPNLLLIYCFDMCVQFGSFTSSIEEGRTVPLSVIIPFAPKTSEEIVLLKITAQRARHSRWAKDVMARKSAIIQKKENVIIHGKKFSYSKLTESENV